ncbi:unnamed protein product [Mucor circinelloides]
MAKPPRKVRSLMEKHDKDLKETQHGHTAEDLYKTHSVVDLDRKQYQTEEGVGGLFCNIRNLLKVTSRRQVHGLNKQLLPGFSHNACRIHIYRHSPILQHTN